MRLAKYLALCGVDSRRHCEVIVRKGLVKVNGLSVVDPAFSVSDGDTVELDGERVFPLTPSDLRYIAYHKPVGVVCSMEPSHPSGPTLRQMLAFPLRIFPVGRLDRTSSGLIILTNDGLFAQRILHPRHKIEKEYEVRLNRELRLGDGEKILKGVAIEGRVVEVHQLNPIKPYLWRIVIHEGRKRIVRRLFKAMGYTVEELKRVRIGPIWLGRLPVGKWRNLTKREIELILQVNSPKEID